MNGQTGDRFSAVVIGGSVGGLAAAHALHRAGARVSVFEQSAQQIHARGAGIVMQPEVEHLLRRIGSSAEAVSVPLHERQRIDRGGSIRRFHAPQLMTSWGALYRVLRGALPGIPYHLGHELVSAETGPRGATARFADGRTVTGDVLIGADGIGSAVRRTSGVPGDRGYAGYLAWRGLEPEADLPASIVDVLEGSFTFFAAPGLQFLSYLVPGPRGETARGSRQVNWVWYVNTGAAAAAQALTGRTGKHYRSFLPPGEVMPRTHEALLQLADRHLPKVFAELVAASKVFMQPIVDVPAARMRTERIMLIGDAAGTVRPHTASGTSKAFGDAMALAEALHEWDPLTPPPSNRLAAWEQHRRTELNRIAHHGVGLAASSGLGTGNGPQFLQNLASMSSATGAAPATGTAPQ